MTEVGVPDAASAALGGPLGGYRSGRGEPVVFVHGFSQSSRSWERVLKELPAGFESLAVDLPGHAGSSEVHAKDLSEAADLIGQSCGEAFYVGYSLGGRTCLHLALEQPELVHGLVLIGATPGIVQADGRRDRRLADEAIADRLDPSDSSSGISLESFLSEWLAGPLFAHLNAEQADVSSRLSNTTKGLADSLRFQGTGTQVPSHHLLGGLEMPVLLVAGALDQKFTEIAYEMKEAIGENAEVAFVAKSGHAAPFEQPKAFARLLTSWLNAHRGTSFSR